MLGFTSYEGTSEVFLAELLTVIRGLALAWSRGFKKNICTSDCLLVVQALDGSRSLNLHASYLAEAKSLIHQDWEVKLQHRNREHNVHADALAKLGLQSCLGFSIWTTPPPELVPLVGCGIVDSLALFFLLFCFLFPYIKKKV